MSPAAPAPAGPPVPGDPAASPDPVADGPPGTRELGLLLAIVALGAALRGFRLGAEGLWMDELGSALWAGLPLPALLRELLADGQAPLFYLLQAGILRVLGSGEAAARLLSCLAGIATIPLLHSAGRRLVSPAAGLLAAFLLATSPYHVHYSREGRPYALLILLVGLCLLAGLHLLRRPGIGATLLLAASGLGVILTHVLGVFVLAGLGLGLLVAAEGEQARRARRSLLAAGLLVTAAFLPLVPILLEQAGDVAPTYGWASAYFTRDWPFQVPRSLAALSPGALPPVNNLTSDLGAGAWPALALVGLATLLGWRSRRSWARRRVLSLLGLAGLLPLVATWLASWLLAPVHLVGRSDAGSLPFVLLAVSTAAASSTPWRRVVPLAFALLAVLPLRAELGSTRRSRERTAMEVLAAQAAPGDVVLLAGPFQRAARYYLLRARPELALRVFPAEFEVRPTWIDPDLPRAALERQADELSAWAAGALSEPAGGRAFLLAAPEPFTPILVEALARRFVPDRELDAGRLPAELWCLRPREVAAPGAPSGEADPAARGPR